jgi:hypothetical protein
MRSVPLLPSNVNLAAGFNVKYLLLNSATKSCGLTGELYAAIAAVLERCVQPNYPPKALANIAPMATQWERLLGMTDILFRRRTLAKRAILAMAT